MSEELMQLNPEIENGMATMTPDKIAKIRERMVKWTGLTRALVEKTPRPQTS